MSTKYIKTSVQSVNIFVYIYLIISGVMVILAGNGHDDTSSNSGWDWLHFT